MFDLEGKTFLSMSHMFQCHNFAGRLFYSQVDETSEKLHLVTPNDCYSKPFYEIISFLVLNIT